MYRLPLPLQLKLSGYTSSILSRTNLSGPCAVPGAQSVGKPFTGATFKRTKYFAERDITVRLYHKLYKGEYWIHTVLCEFDMTAGNWEVRDHLSDRNLPRNEVMKATIGEIYT
jgi:hypothetical protein